MKPKNLNMMKRTILLSALVTLFSTLALSQVPLDDVDIADAIEDQFRFDHAINVNKIDVEVLDGIVTLEGTVQNLKAKERATRVAELVKGVRAVSNLITIQPAVVMSDHGIRENVEQALLNDPATDSYEVAVSVENKEVTLTGTVDSYQEKELCGHVAKSVRGVVGLTNNIHIDYDQDRPDREIQAEIEEALRWNVLVDDGLINVEVEEGEVELSGIVGSAAEKTNAFFTSWVTGVTSVDNSGLEVEWWAEDEELRKNQHTPVPDNQIEEAIIDAAVYDPRLLSVQIDPEAENGWVTLRGTVDNLKSKIAAEKLAEHTTGVVGVTNRIKVRVDLPPTDSEIAADVDMALSNNSITESWEIDVEVNNGITTLTGVVDSYLEKKEAEWTAGGVEGVTEVNNLLTVNYPHSYYWWGYYPYHNFYITPPNTSVYPDDDHIRRSVESELWWSPFVDRDQVTVHVEEGEVTLEGTVDSWREYRKAVENAWEGGAWSVDNNLEVR